MRWFWANRIFGGRLALFALAVQLALSFGHIHREDIFGYGTRERRASRIVGRCSFAAEPGQPLARPSRRLLCHLRDDFFAEFFVRRSGAAAAAAGGLPAHRACRARCGCFHRAATRAFPISRTSDRVTLGRC